MPTRPRPSSRASVVGFNATRRYRDSKARDVVLLVVAVAVIGLLVAWAAGLW